MSAPKRSRQYVIVAAAVLGVTAPACDRDTLLPNPTANPTASNKGHVAPPAAKPPTGHPAPPPPGHRMGH